MPIALLLPAAMASGAGGSSPSAACVVPRSTAIARRMAGLPVGARTALARLYANRAGIADVGAPWEVSDAISDPKLPRVRLMRGYRLGDRLIVWVEMGGIAHQFRTVEFRRRGTAYDVVADSPRAGDLCKNTQAALAGAKR